MRKILLFMLLSVSCLAQNLTAVSGSKVTYVNGTLLPTGNICFLATDQNNVPISFQQGGGGQVLKKAKCSPINAGVITGFNVPNPANTNPAGIFYRITINDGTTTFLEYDNVSFAGSPFNFDNYAPSPGPTVPPAGGTISGNLSIAGNLSVTGTFTGPGIGTVTSFSAGNLSPLFTTSVSNPSTTPSQTFTLSNAAANSVFGNNTGSSGAPAFSNAVNVSSVTATTVSGVTLTSTVATGTPPLTVASTTTIPNLSASFLSGFTFAAPLPIGATTPNTGVFTTLTANTLTDGFNTLNAGQINRAGANVELQFGATASSKVRVGGNGSNPTTIDANTGAITATGSYTSTNGNLTLTNGQITAGSTIHSGGSVTASGGVSANGTVSGNDASFVSNMTAGGVVQNGSTATFDAFALKAKRFTSERATAVVAGDFALSGGWGSTASVGSLVGHDSAFAFTITSSGTGQAANPTVTFTFHDGSWTNSPLCLLTIFNIGSNTAPGTLANTTESATAPVFTNNTFTPVAAQTYRVTGRCEGR